MVKVNPTLKIWWEDIKKNRELEANELLGGLTVLISIELDHHLIKILLKFWDTERLVFRFKDFDLTPTFERGWRIPDSRIQRVGNDCSRQAKSKIFSEANGHAS